MRRPLRRLVLPAVAACLVALLPGGVPASAAAAAYGWGGLRTFPTNRTVDTALYDGGTWSYTDRWGDATGASSDGLHREDYFPGQPLLTYDAFGTHRLAHEGDYVLPNDDARFPELTTDLVFAQVRPSAAGLDVRVVWTSLRQADSAILTLGIDTDGGTQSSSFPRDARLACTGCGVDRWVTAWGTGGEVADAGGAHVGGLSGLHVSLPDNVVSFRVPAAALGPLGTSARLWLASGAHDGSGHYLPVQPTSSTTAPGGGTGGTNVFDLAFVSEDRSTLDERVQADLLARGEAGPAAATVDLGLLRRGGHRLVGEPTSGSVERVLVSALNRGDGIDTGNGTGTFQSPTPGGNYHYLTRTQPYLVDLPTGWTPARRSPMVVALHGYNGYVDELHFLAPQMRQAMAAHGFLAVYPLGRGDVQYEHDGENDVLEVQRAAAAQYPTDPDRVHVAGISMGGFGSTKMVTRHPDVFASGSVAVGAEQQDINVVNDRLEQYPLNRFFAPVVQNLQDTPVVIEAGSADADPATSTANALYQQLRAVGDEAHLKTYLLRSHEPEVLDDSTPQMLAVWQSARRTAVPARVHYAFDTSWDFVSLVDDSAYWVSGLTPASGTQGTVDAEALTLPRPVTALTETPSEGGDPAVRSTYTLLDSARTTTGQRPTRNALRVDLTGVATSRVDLRGLQVDRTRRWCVDVTSDVTTTMALTGLDLRAATIAGAPATSTAAATTLTLPAGTSHVVVAPAGVPADVGTPCA